jgi:cytochrome P450
LEADALPVRGRSAGAPDDLTPLSCDRFDRSLMAASANGLLSRLLDYPAHRWIFRLLRWLAPVFRLPLADFGPLAREPLADVYVVTRYDDVREVLARNDDFPVPWAEKMEALTDGENFVLGMPDDDRYRLSYAQLATVFMREDVPQYLVRRAAEISAERLAGKKSLDVIQDLMWAVPTQLTGEYYGIPMPDRAQFAFWTVAISGHLFGPPFVKPQASPRAAAGCLRAAIDEGIAQAKSEVAKGMQREHHVLHRLVRLGVSDEVIRAQLFGMVLGFIPTNLIASGNILDTLLRFPAFMEAARAAALEDDDERLWRCLQEALRFRYINPGAWRRCRPEGATIAAGTRRQARIPGGAYLLVSVQSAMFDERRIKLPGEFDPERPAEDYMVFGYGQHWCIGAFIAIAQITQTFKALLRHEGLRRAGGPSGQLRRINIYPAYMTVELG